MSTPYDQLELFSAVDPDDLSWEEWFSALPLTPPSRPQPLPDPLTLPPEPEQRRAA
jgi:hypothetical protein